MKSFSILRTHTGLSTNVKIMVDSKYSLYLESIDSTPELAASRFKKVQFNKNNFLDELVPYFLKTFQLIWLLVLNTIMIMQICQQIFPLSMKIFILLVLEI